MSTVESPLSVHGLAKAFGDATAVNGVDFSLEPGEVLALVGPSGCGKSTLLRMIAGLVPADSGTIHLGGELVEDGKSRLAPERRSTGLVFQEHSLFPHLTVGENISFGLRGDNKSNRQSRVDAMMEMVDLSGFGGRYPHELSGGERQRIALARALAPEPSIMLFDEPFASLDQNLRVQLRQDIVSALRATQTPAVFVTHDQREALSLGDRIAVMQSGKIAQMGTPEEIFHRPANRFIGSFMGEASFLPIDQTEAGQMATVLGPVPLDGLVQREMCCAMVRPDDVEFVPDSAGDAVVTTAEYSGAAWLASAKTNNGEHVLFSRNHLVPPTVGQRGRLELVPGHRQVVIGSPT